MPVLVLYACQKLFSQTKVALKMRNRWSCKVVYKDLRSVNTSEASCIAFLPVCVHFCIQEVEPKELKENSMGLSLGYLSVPEFLLLLGEWNPWKLLLVCSLFASDGRVKRGGGVFGTVCVSVLKLKPRGGEGGGGCLMNRKTGLLLCSPHCWSFPSCFACPLTELFMALGLAPDLSHTCQQQQVFFLWVLHYHHFPTSTVPHKTAW